MKGEEPMRVWVLSPRGRRRGTVGVFATAEAAKAFISYAEWCDEADELGDWYTKGRWGYCVYQEEVRT